MAIDGRYPKNWFTKSNFSAAVPRKLPDAVVVHSRREVLGHEM
jgi:hypothetical protein